MRHEQGSVTVEAVLLAPVLAIGFLSIVYGSRLVASSQAVQLAADHGARTASTVRYSKMDEVGVEAALHYLDEYRSGCRDARVNVAVDQESDRPSVLVEVECEVDTSGLSFLGLMPKTLRAHSIEVVDVWRANE